MFSAGDNWYIRVDVSNFRRLPIDGKKREATAFRYFRCHRRGKCRRASGNDRLGRTVLRRNNLLRPLPRKIKSENLIAATTDTISVRSAEAIVRRMQNISRFVNLMYLAKRYLNRLLRREYDETTKEPIKYAFQR